ncbi:MAG: hypothetical protein ACM3VS_12485 [Candidatus Dadabacteria bacterium]
MLRNEKQTLSLSLNGRIIIGFILLLLLVQIGFYKTYTSHFPGFQDYLAPGGRKFHFSWIKHFHGMMMMGWMLMLLVQPILIMTGKIKWHHRVGRLSYVLAPLVLISLWLITQERFSDILERQGQHAALAHLSLNFPNIIFFALLYSLAIYYRKRSDLHIPFMCGTAILLIGPALARILIIYFGFTLDHSVTISKMVMVAVPLLIAVADGMRRKRVSAFTIVAAVMIVNALLWLSRNTDWWQATGSAIEKTFL